MLAPRLTDNLNCSSRPNTLLIISLMISVALVFWPDRSDGNSARFNPKTRTKHACCLTYPLLYYKLKSPVINTQWDFVWLLEKSCLSLWSTNDIMFFARSVSILVSMKSTLSTVCSSRSSLSSTRCFKVFSSRCRSAIVILPLPKIKNKYVVTML